MSAKEKAVRDAAMKLHEAILDAKADGLVVTWPHRVDDLPAIAISETGKVKAPPKPTVATIKNPNPDDAGKSAKPKT